MVGIPKDRGHGLLVVNHIHSHRARPSQGVVSSEDRETLGIAKEMMGRGGVKSEKMPVVLAEIK